MKAKRPPGSLSQRERSRRKTGAAAVIRLEPPLILLPLLLEHCLLYLPIHMLLLCTADREQLVLKIPISAFVVYHDFNLTLLVIADLHCGFAEFGFTTAPDHDLSFAKKQPPSPDGMR